MLRLNKKLGLLTLNGYDNYGNRLQNYALERTIERLGFEVETILVSRRSTDTFLQRLFRCTIKEAMNKILIRIRLHKNREHIGNRTDRFIQFSNKYLHETSFSLTLQSEVNNLDDKYDCFVVGSDQVWNPHNLHGTTFFFLTFAEKHKRVAYAASFGISDLPDKYIEQYKTWLDGMNRISVREYEGAKIVEKITGKKPMVLLDPTLLLDKSDWLRISEPSMSKPKKDYLLTYFLGAIPPVIESEIQQIAKNNNLQVVRLADLRDLVNYTCGPSEFIDYMNDCKLFLTDSFHGTVFSILFEKPFFVFERAGSISMYSRISTLLRLFHLEDRATKSIEKRTDMFHIDYSSVPLILEAERNRAFDYLKEAISAKE